MRWEKMKCLSRVKAALSPGMLEDPEKDKEKTPAHKDWFVCLFVCRA